MTTADEELKRISVNAQSSICIEGSPKIYLDPFKIEKESHDADLILFTHPHHDHFSPDDFRKAAKDPTVYVATYALKDKLLRAGIQSENTILLNSGERMNEKGVEIKGIPAYNIRKPMHKKKSGWLGYVLNIDGIQIYDAGDTDAITEGEAVKADIVFVPIGGLFTMNAKEAAAFVNQIKPQAAIPIHYGTIIGKPSDADKFEKYVDNSIKVVRKLVFN